jgi:uncharacterized protein (TIGR00725 family)
MKIIAVIGNADDSHVSKKIERIAYEAGEEIAKSGSALICGGMGGVMKAACKGAASRNGVTIGVLPFMDKKIANKFVSIPLCSGMPIGMRDNIVVHSADAIIAIGGGSGTMGEIALAYMYEKPVIAILGTGGWANKLKGEYIDERKKAKVISARTAKEAVKLALRCKP